MNPNPTNIQIRCLGDGIRVVLQQSNWGQFQYFLGYPKKIKFFKIQPLLSYINNSRDKHR